MAGLLQDTEGYAWAGGLAEGIKSGLLAYTDAQEFAQRKQLQQLQIDKQRREIEMNEQNNKLNKLMYNQFVTRNEKGDPISLTPLGEQMALYKGLSDQAKVMGEGLTVDKEKGLVWDPNSPKYQEIEQDKMSKKAQYLNTMATLKKNIEEGTLSGKKFSGQLSKEKSDYASKNMKEGIETVWEDPYDPENWRHTLKPNEGLKRFFEKTPTPKTPQELENIEADTELKKSQAKKNLRPPGKEKGKTIPEGGVSQIADLKDQLENLTNVEESWRRLVGPVKESSGGFLGSLFQQGDVISKRAQGLLKNTSVDEYKNLRKQYAQAIGKALEGGKLTDADYERKYIDFVPDVGDSESQAIGKLNNLRAMMQNKHNNLVTTLGNAGYDTENIALENKEFSKKTPKVETINEKTKMINGQKWIKEGAGWRKAK